MMRVRILLSVAAGGLLMPGLATAAAAAAPPTPSAVASTRTDGFTTVATAATDSRSVRAAAGYWTAQRMRDAVPYDVVSTGNDASPAPSTRSDAQAQGNASLPVGPVAAPGRPATAANATVPSTAGKLFFTINGSPYVCSAATINNAYKNLVETAGHCVYEGGGGGWHANIMFAPAYYNGDGPTGDWSWATAGTFNSWINSKDFSHDQAFVTFLPKNGRNLVNAVGGNGLSYGYGPCQDGVRIWGWPAENPYNGQVPYYCDGSTYRHGLFSSDAYMNCSMNGGASGGPWLRARVDANLGYVFAVTSRRTTSGTARLLATPNSQDVYTMFKLMH